MCALYDVSVYRCELRLIIAHAAACLGAALVSSSADAQDSADEAGFEAMAPTVNMAAPEQSGTQAGSASEVPEQTPWTLTGSLRLDSVARLSSNVSDVRLNHLRQTSDLRLSYSMGDSRLGFRAVASGRIETDFAYLLNNSVLSDRATYNLYAYQLMARENFIDMHFGRLEVVIGRQIVNLGQGEMVSALDSVNPRDMRAPLLIDPTDTRMPVLLTRLTWASSSVRLELLVVHEPNFGLLPPPLGELSPLRKLLQTSGALDTIAAEHTLIYRHIPENDLRIVSATQPYARVTWTGPGFDLSFSAGSPLDQLGVSALPDPAAFKAPQVEFPIYHPRYAFAAVSGAVALGPLLLRWELVADYKRTLPLRALDSTLLFDSERFTQAHGLLGLTFVPSQDTTAALEVLQSYVVDNPARRAGATLAPLWPIEQPQFAFRFSQTLWSENLTLSGVFLLIGAQVVNAWAARLELSYGISQGVLLNAGVVVYWPTSHFGPFYGIEQRERAFLGARWDFAQ